MLEWPVTWGRRLERARDILPTLYGKEAKPDRDEELALAYWETAAGEWLASRTRARSLNRGGLIIEVDSPRWQGELESLSGRLIGRLNGLIGRTAVRRLLFRLATPAKKPPQQAASSTAPASSEDVSDPIRRRAYERSKRAVGS